ncbi:hypothetical protein [Motilimonas eburnea]|uniref:hypothetical protein n=1 Tax=Motilimonas eburnea TaxID=1737488 RepID=UPI001E60A9EE|nr:hypothetical protein [Motilimonas eburnea]MCE2572414.1 hypothetical protein [Motilimonas eburnea]
MTARWKQNSAYLLSVTMLLMTLAASGSASGSGAGVLVCAQAGFYSISLAEDGSSQTSRYCALCLVANFVFDNLPQLTFGERLAASYLLRQHLAVLSLAVPLYFVKPLTRAPPSHSAL